MNPLLGTFIRLTLAIAGVILAFFLLFVIIKVVLVAAILAALAVGGIFLFNFFRKQRRRLPVVR
ncbi:MAG: hypothetical protein ACYDGM_11190 [Vulcanimicrobiaceae bacterium]